MFDILIEAVSDTRLLAMAFAALAAVATVITLAMPLLATDSLSKRMKSVALEREQMRQRFKERRQQNKERRKERREERRLERRHG